MIQVTEKFDISSTMSIPARNTVHTFCRALLSSPSMPHTITLRSFSPFPVKSLRYFEFDIISSKIDAVPRLLFH